jgi:hypothetical protein
VLQTTAGKMIFGKFDERSAHSGERPVPVLERNAASPERPPRREQAVGETSS